MGDPDGGEDELVAGEDDRLPEAAQIFATWRVRADMRQLGIFLGHLPVMVTAVARL